jgi:hypothetical protein
MKYLNTIEAKGGVLFDTLRDFTFDEARQGFLYFDDNILGDSAHDGVITTPALKVKIYENPNTKGYIPPSKTNFHYVLTSYLSKDVNHTGFAVAGGILKATDENGAQELPLSKAAATSLKKDTANKMLELRRVNLERGRITNAQIVPIYDSELVTKKWVESKLGSFTLQADATGLTYLDSTTHTAGLVMEASQADYVFEQSNPSELEAFIANAVRDKGDGEEKETRQITAAELNAADPIIVFVEGKITLSGTEYSGSYRVASATNGKLNLAPIPVPVWFKEPTYALSVYELSTDNYSKDGSNALIDIRFNLTATGNIRATAEAAGAAMMANNSYSGSDTGANGAKIAGAGDIGKFARVTCIAEDGTTTFLTYICSQGTAPAVVQWDPVLSGVSRSYKQVFPDIAFIEATVENSDPMFKLQLGFANPLAKGAKFYVAFAG